MTNVNQPVSKSQAIEWAIRAAQTADDKKGVDTVILDVGDLLAITEAFVITSAANNRLVKSIAEDIEKRLKEEGGPSPRRLEGRNDASWILMDYGDFVVHVFLDETREFYDLERLWGDAPKVEWEPQTKASNA